MVEIKQYLLMVLIAGSLINFQVNLVNNSGVVAADVTGVGTARLEFRSSLVMEEIKHYLDLLMVVHGSNN